MSDGIQEGEIVGDMVFVGGEWLVPVVLDVLPGVIPTLSEGPMLGRPGGCRAVTGPERAEIVVSEV